MIRVPTILCLLVASAIRCLSATAQEAHPEHGGSLRTYAPDRAVDVESMRLKVRFDDLSTRSFHGEEWLRFRPLRRGLTEVSFDAVGLAVGSVAMASGRQIPFEVADGRVRLQFEPPLGTDPVEIRFSYDCVNPPHGMTFAPALPGGRPWQVHTQGQAESNRNWFICHDSPNDRMATEVLVAPPEGMVASSNGAFCGVVHEDGRDWWWYRQPESHVAYLVSVVAGDFARVPLKTGLTGVPMHVWVEPGQEPMVERTYGRTGEMIDTLSRALGVRYPWARYDQLLVRCFGSGGMENTTVTSLVSNAILDEACAADGDWEGLISHELGHQWFGDFVTCRTWEHIWLNEGWATYCENLWFEERDGPDGYFDEVLDNFGVAERDTMENTVPMVSSLYSHPGECFGRSANPYPKGASILHMLREELGDEEFFEGVRLYLGRHAFGLVETDDFRVAMEDSSGRSLEWFFDQWCLRPGTPRIKATHAWDPAQGRLTVTLEQTQRIDAQTPAFRAAIPVLVAYEGGEALLSADMRQRTATVECTIPSSPTMVVVDPRLSLLAIHENDFPTAWLVEGMRNAPTNGARRLAARSLGGHDDAESREALAAVARDPGIRQTLRSEAARALARQGSAESKALLVALWDGGIGDPRVRRTVAEGLSGAAPEGALERLVRAAREDASPGVRTAAAAGIAALVKDPAANPEACAAVVALLGQPTSTERLRMGAADACGSMALPEAVEPLLAIAQPGTFDRLRAAAIRAAAKVAERHPEVRSRVKEAMEALKDDGEHRASEAARDTLAAIEKSEARDSPPAEAAAAPSPTAAAP